MEEVREGRQLHSEELRGVACSTIQWSDQIGRMRRAGACGTDRRKGNVDGALAEKPEGNSPSKTLFVTQEHDTESPVGTQHHDTETPVGTQHNTETPVGTQHNTETPVGTQ